MGNDRGHRGKSRKGDFVQVNTKTANKKAQEDINNLRAQVRELKSKIKDAKELNERLKALQGN